MKVQEFIEQLQKLDPELDVVVNFTDHTGENFVSEAELFDWERINYNKISGEYVVIIILIQNFIQPKRL